jgi:hypothetical protein
LAEEAESPLEVLSQLPPGTWYLRLEAAGLVVRNVAVRLWRAEEGTAQGEPAVKLVTEDEATVNVSNLKRSYLDAQGRAVLETAQGSRVILGLRPW